MLAAILSDLEGLAARCEIRLVRRGQVESVSTTHRLAPLAVAGLQAVRRIGGMQGGQSRTGMFASRQDGQAIMLETESWLEMANLMRLQFEQEAAWLLTQPMVMQWDVDGRALWRIPDILAVTPQGVRVVDVKPEARRDAYSQAVFALTAATLDRVGVGYEVAPELSRQAAVNLRAISGMRWPNPSLELEVQAARTARRHSLGGVIDSAGGGGVGEWVAFHLLTHELCVDLDQPLLMTSPTWWRS